MPKEYFFRINATIKAVGQIVFVFTNSMSLSIDSYYIEKNPLLSKGLWIVLL